MKKADKISVDAVGDMVKWLHKSPCRISPLLKLDVGTKDPENLEHLYKAIKDTKVMVAAEARGGFRLFVER